MGPAWAHASIFASQNWIELKDDFFIPNNFIIYSRLSGVMSRVLSFYSPPPIYEAAAECGDPEPAIEAKRNCCFSGISGRAVAWNHFQFQKKNWVWVYSPMWPMMCLGDGFKVPGMPKVLL